VRSKCLQSLHELTISTKNRVSKLVYSHSLPIPIVSPLEGTRTTPDYLVNRVLTKNKGPHPKNLYRNREIVVEWKVGVWEKGQLTRVEMGWVLQPIQTLKEYFHVTSVALTLVPLGTLVRSPWFFPTKIIFIQKHFSPMTGWGSGHLRSPALRNDPGTVTIPQYRFNKTKQHTGRGSGYPRSPALRNDPGNVTITQYRFNKNKTTHTLRALRKWGGASLRPKEEFGRMIFQKKSSLGVRTYSSAAAARGGGNIWTENHFSLYKGAVQNFPYHSRGITRSGASTSTADSWTEI